MSRGQDKRIAKLERKRRPAKIIMIWQDREKGWTQEEAIARAYPEGVPPGAQIMLLSWPTRAEVKAAEENRASLGQADP
jgi:hypothetical protein